MDQSKSFMKDAEVNWEDQLGAPQKQLQAGKYHLNFITHIYISIVLQKSRKLLLNMHYC